MCVLPPYRICMDFVAQLHINVYFKSSDVKARMCELSLMLIPWISRGWRENESEWRGDFQGRPRSQKERVKEVRCMNFSHCQHPSKYISLLLPFSMCSSSSSRIYTKHCLHWVLNDKALFRKTSFSLTMCLLNCLPSKMCKNKRLTTVYKSFKLSTVNKEPFPASINAQDVLLGNPNTESIKLAWLHTALRKQLFCVQLQM